MFVKSKSGEIHRRIAQSEKIVNMIAEKDEAVASNPDSKIRSKTRESLVLRLRQEVFQLTRDLQRLSRFIGVQRTGFRKLLKKYKKWSKSSALSERFLPILEAPTSFTNQDFTSAFLELSLLYNVLRQAKLTNITVKPHVYPSNENLCMFDCEMVTALANSVIFWIHPDNVVETKITLLRNLSLVSDSTLAQEQGPTYSADGTIASSQSLPTKRANISIPNSADASLPQDEVPAKDLTYTTYLDNSKKLYSIQTKSEPGQIHSVYATHAASTPVLCSPVGGLRHFCIANLSTVQEEMILKSQHEALNGTTKGMDNMSKVALSWVQKRHASPISKTCSHRTRFRYTERANASTQPDMFPGPSANSQWDQPDVWVTLDSNIKMTKSGALQTQWTEFDDEQTFPYCVLDVRWKGLEKPAWLVELERSHLVYPVDGFSLYAHSIAVYYPNSLSVLPRWLNVIQENLDIRRVPETRSALTKQRGNSKSSSNITSQLSQTPVSPGILLNNERMPLINNNPYTLGRTPSLLYGAADDHNQELKRSPADQPVVRYWNEFDDPEDGTEEGVFVVIPEEDMEDVILNGTDVAFLINLTDRLFDKAARWKRKLRKWFSNKPKRRHHRGLSTISEDDELSFDDDDDDDNSEDIDYEGFYSPRFKPHHFSNNGDVDDIYYSFPPSLVADQRNNLITALYTICFFLSALMVGTLFVAILTEDMSGISQGTYLFIVCGFFIALAIGVLAMGLFLLRAEMPPWWHQTIVFTVFFSIICFGVGGVAWLFT